ncbi:DHH family phosphoesterase [Candidatus Micrarchaeota archaeon]|nr:DHH family phosphoesterase [Candidatus Micrarchaeota archaeon]
MVKELHKIFEEFLAKYRNSKLAVATHSRADVDSISSAFAISKVFPNSIICTSEEMREGAKMLADKFGIKVRDLSKVDKKKFDGLIVVDTSTYTLLPEARGWKILGIIDHHRAEGRDMKAEFEMIDHESPSTAEIISNLLPKISKEEAFALSVGIIADAARFKSARKETFETLAKLMGIAEAKYAEMLVYAEPEPREEAKIAMLNAMSRVKFVYTAGYIIATTEVGSNESDAASLIAEAADVAFVASWRDKEQETRISARARPSMEVPLNKVMATVGKELGGAGGGHPKAAGLSAKAHTQETLEKCIEIFIRFAEKEN